MKYFLNYLCLCLAFHLPLTTRAEPTGTVLYTYPREDYSELWITNLENTIIPRMLFKYTSAIYEIAAQENGPLVIMVAGHSVVPGFTFFEVFLVNRRHPDKEARDLTQHRFDGIQDLDILENGDIIFTNYHTDGAPPPKRGIYLIPNREIKKEVPKARLLKEAEAVRAVWAPGGKMIAYDIDGGHGIYTLDVGTRKASQISDFGRFPAFSPDGKKLAFVSKLFVEPQNIYVVSFENPEDRKTIEPVIQSKNIHRIKWTPDGQYIVYNSNGIFAAPINGGPHIKLFDNIRGLYEFDWASSKGYAVEPAKKLTTLWGALKVDNTQQVNPHTFLELD